jgi:hypothetical protein
MTSRPSSRRPTWTPATMPTCPSDLVGGADVNRPAFDAHVLLRGIMPNKWDRETEENAVRLVVTTPQMTTPLEWANDHRRSPRDELRDT